MTDALDPEAAHEALQALGLAPGARLLALDDLILSLVPREGGLQPKDIPVEQVLAKVRMMRDKLRVLEQRINSADGVSDVERAQLQGHITAVYASFAGLVSFFSSESLPVVEVTAPAVAKAPTTTAATTSARCSRD
jgi:hypothetical protein